jgi:hypothetical protein
MILDAAFAISAPPAMKTFCQSSCFMPSATETMLRIDFGASSSLLREGVRRYDKSYRRTDGGTLPSHGLSPHILLKAVPKIREALDCH